VGPAWALDVPAGGFISLCPIGSPTCGVLPNSPPGTIDHIGIGIENYDGDRVEATLRDAGHQNVTNAGSSVLLTDPDGATLQLSAADEDFAI